MIRWLVAIALLFTPAFGCSCRSFTVCDMIRQPVVFIGEVIGGGITSIQQDPWNSDVSYAKFRVIESFRGLPAGTRTVDVKLNSWKGRCSPVPYYSGKRYLVMPGTIDSELVDGPCFSGRDITDIPETITQLRDYFQGEMPVTIQGTVAATYSKPLHGATVSASRNGKVFSTQTDTRGRYQLNLPSGGDYTTTASLPPYIPTQPRRTSVERRGCAWDDFALQIDNTISGRVWDQQGQPISAKVGLIDLDHPDLEYPTYSRHTFRFEDVPLGRYLLMYNPDGPSPNRRENSFESTYYPGASSRVAALPIEIKSSGVHLEAMDLIVGKPVEFRQVTVHVRFPDGTPMEHAIVECVGSPLEQDESECSYRGATLKDGDVQFSVPVNRKFRIEIKDRYGRDLKASYISQYEPGRTPITKEFIVKP